MLLKQKQVKTESVKRKLVKKEPDTAEMVDLTSSPAKKRKILVDLTV
jgi:hypothetical protein